MYGDIQMIAVVDSAALNGGSIAQGAEIVVGFNIPGLDPATDVILSASPFMVPFFATNTYTIDAVGHVNVTLISIDDPGILSVGDLLRFTIARCRAFNTGVLL